MLFCRIEAEMLSLHNKFRRMFLKNIAGYIPVGLMSIIILGVIAYVSLDGDPFDAHRIILFEGADKVIHAIMYLTLTAVFLFDLAKYRRTDMLSVKYFVISAVTAFIYSGLMEYLQHIMGLGRSASVGDLVANFVGVCLGVLLMKCCFLKWLFGNSEHKNVK